jgi:hypothetical protein
MSLEQRLSDHLTNEQIARYHGRALTPAELIRLDSHLASCAECHRGLSAAGFEQAKVLSLKQAVDSAPLSEHLDYDQLAAHAEGTLKGVAAETVQSHLASCAHCELLASDLKVFRDEIVTDLDERYLPSPVRAMAPPPRERFSDSLKAFFSFKSPAFALGVGALALLVAGISIWLTQHSKTVNNSMPQVAESASPGPETSPQANVNVTPGSSPQLPSQALIALNDGSRNVAVNEKGELTGLDDLPPSLRQTIKTAINTQHASNPTALAGLSGQQGKLRGEGEDAAFTLVSPIKVVISSDKPTLHWNKLNGATRYQVAMYDSKFNLVTSSPPLTRNNWTLPRALRRGEVYSWRVTATKDGQEIKSPVPPAPEAKFKVLDRAHADELNRARRIYSGSHLTLGVLYAQAGLLAEAEREFSALAKANPQSTVAHNLLRDVRAARR